MAFYTWGAPSFVFILFSSTVIDYYLVHQLHRSKEDGHRRRWLSLSILLNLGLLFYFKYAGFFVENITGLFETWGWGNTRHLEILLPIGISFYTFQTLTYSIDVFRKKVEPLEKLGDYLLYIFLFPQMIAGPIVRFASIAQELRSRETRINDFYLGMERFALGLGKKVLLANPAGAVADRFMGGSMEDLSAPQAWLGIFAYTLQIYFDFSGYSDMAIGLGRALGFRFPENFKFPYLSKNITEFWRRWHITLGAWMRDYLYIPLGGNQVGNTRTYLNLWIVFLASGLWHGAAWNFVLWGAFHGLLLVVERLFRKRALLSKLPSAIQILWTFFLVMMGWVIFRIEEMPLALEYYQVLFTGSWEIPAGLLSNYETVHLMLAAIICLMPLLPRPQIKAGLLPDILLGGRALISLSLLFFSLIWIASSGFNPFIYFRF